MSSAKSNKYESIEIIQQTLKELRAHTKYIAKGAMQSMNAVVADNQTVLNSGKIQSNADTQRGGENNNRNDSSLYANAIEYAKSCSNIKHDESAPSEGYVEYDNKGNATVHADAYRPVRDSHEHSSRQGSPSQNTSSPNNNRSSFQRSIVSNKIDHGVSEGANANRAYNRWHDSDKSNNRDRHRL